MDKQNEIFLLRHHLIIYQCSGSRIRLNPHTLAAAFFSPWGEFNRSKPLGLNLPFTLGESNWACLGGNHLWVYQNLSECLFGNVWNCHMRCFPNDFEEKNRIKTITFIGFHWKKPVKFRGNSTNLYKHISLNYHENTPWKINMVHLQITHLERKMIFQRFQTSMIMFQFFQGVMIFWVVSHSQDSSGKWSFR